MGAAIRHERINDIGEDPIPIRVRPRSGAASS
jgi:hypothetical protein